MILSDRSIREEVAAGRIVIEPFDDSCVQPSSVDLHIDRFFRVFRNHTMGLIDVKQEQEELTELVQIPEGDRFMLHPGEFVLGSTLERVALPDDLVARLEGKSSLGRLGLLIHSSLPGSEQVLILDDSGLRARPISEVVAKRVAGSVVSFDPVTFAVEYFPITGWYEGPPDRIYEVRLKSGRRVRVTAGHNLFTLDRNGSMTKVRTAGLQPGTLVAIPRRIPDPSPATSKYDFRELVPENVISEMVFGGPTVAAAFEDQLVRRTLKDAGYKHVDYYAKGGLLPANVARLFPSVWAALGPRDRIRPRGSRHTLPVVIEVDRELAWLIGFYVAEGYRRRGQVVLSNTDIRLLDRVESVLRQYDQPVYRSEGHSITSASSILSNLMDWIGTGGKAPDKRLPPAALGWPEHLLDSLLEGLLDGDGSHSGSRRCYWSSSQGLVDDVLCLAERLGIRAAASFRDRAVHGLFQVSLPENEHKLLTAVPLPDRLLVDVRVQAGFDQRTAAELAGYAHPTDLCNIEQRSGRDSVRLATLRRLAAVYGGVSPDSDETKKLQRLVEGDLSWDRVESVTDTGMVEPIYDLEVRPGCRKIENFVAGAGGVFVSNTAGFVDSGWDGHLTLELSNVANLPITLYPGMKIGQISFLRMTTSAEHPYGSREAGSKYQGQRGPTPSRYFENFRPPPD